MSWRPTTALLAAMLVLATPARAQTNSGQLITFGGPSPGTLVAETNIPARTTGDLVASFHGDPAAGCATEGLCGYSGTVIVHPGFGSLFVAKFRRGRRVSYQVFLSPGIGSDQGLTFARVERAGGQCADAQQPNAGNPVMVRGALARLSLLEPGGGLLATRCAGPLDGDLAGALRHATVPLSSLLKGRTRLSLSSSEPFAAHGFAGTLISTVVIQLGRPQPQSLSSTNAFPPGTKTQRVRTVTEQLTGAGAGSVAVLIHGTSDPTECALLDSCGLAGTLTLSPKFSTLDGILSASGPATRPYRDFLSALGLARGNPRGIQLFGTVGWSRDWTVASGSTQSGRCADSGTVAPGEVTLAPQGQGLAAAFFPGTTSRTRCPGPMLPQEQTLATGRLSLSGLRHRTFTLSLGGRQAFEDDGYAAGTRGRLVLTLRRGRITQQISTQPAGT